MTTADAPPPEATRTSGWRFRNFNDVPVYAVDHTEESLLALRRDAAGAGALLLALIEDFVGKVPIVTAVHQWLRRGKPETARRHLWPLLVSSEDLGKRLVHRAEQRSVRCCTLPRSAVLPLQTPGQRAPPSDVAFGVVILRTLFVDRRTRAVFNEFAIVGVLPWFVAERTAPQLESLVLNRDVGAMPPVERALLARCALPKFELLPFGADEPDASLSDEQLLSFCIRWHVARKGRVLHTFFSQIVAAGAPAESVAEECDRQLANYTVRFFPASTAAEALFANPACTMNLFHLWMRRGLAREHRLWMARQISDAVNYIVERHVVACGEAARLLFVDTTVLPALRYFAPRLDARRLDARRVAFDWFAFSRAETTRQLDGVIERHRPLTREREPPAEFLGGLRVVPLSVACHVFCAVYQAALELLSDTPGIALSNAALPPPTPWLVDDSVLPLGGGDTYRRERTVLFDDFPLDGTVHRKVTLTAGVASTATSSTGATALRQSTALEALSVYNLPAENCMVENDAGAADAAEGRQLRVSTGASIPMRRSTSVINVSREALHDVCSNFALADIEDIGSLVEPNPITLLYTRHALPLCARELASVYVETDDYQKYETRKFLFHFFTSLKLPGVEFDEICEFMLCNSHHKNMVKQHKQELDGLRRSSAKFIGDLRQRMIDEGRTVEEAASMASCMGSCRRNAERDKCPYADAARNGDAGKQQLRSRLERANALLRGDSDALLRIVDAATRSPTSGCMQEYVETRRKMNVAVETHDPEALFTYPKHYVYASAEHANRCRTGAQTNTAAAAASAKTTIE